MAAKQSSYSLQLYYILKTFCYDADLLYSLLICSPVYSPSNVYPIIEVLPQLKVPELSYSKLVMQARAKQLIVPPISARKTNSEKVFTRFGAKPFMPPNMIPMAPKLEKPQSA